MKQHTIQLQDLAETLQAQLRALGFKPTDDAEQIILGLLEDRQSLEGFLKDCEEGWGYESN